jgi:large subunit ribosomal protein L14e
MAAIQIGRVCIKIRGREKKRKCVIVDIIDKNFLLITGPPKISGIKRRRVNVKHIQPLQHAIDIQRGMSDDEIEEAISQQDLTTEIQSSD